MGPYIAAVNMAGTEQGEPLADDGESGGENSSHSGSEMKSVGMKGPQGGVTDVGQEQVEETNGGSVKRGRGRPKGSGTKPKIQGSDGPRKRGRPKGSTVNGGTPRKHKLDLSGEESENSLSPPRKRGRPKGSFKKLVYKKAAGKDGALPYTPKRGRPKKGQGKGKRGRPKKIVPAGAARKEPAADGSEPRKGPGRPKGSRNKPVAVRMESAGSRPTRVHVAPDKLNISIPRKAIGKRGRPKKTSRGRPRKTPLPPEEELYQPKVWKALGRPRKHPKVEPPEGAPIKETPRRGRGRPRKSESKKGAHLKKYNSDEGPNKPKVAKEHDGPPRKCGRPKGSVKNEAIINNSSEEILPNSGQNMEEGHGAGDISNNAP